MRDLSRLGQGRLIFEDGSIWKATPFGADGETGGELVFNTALSGYQEVLTDPSYTGQVVMMTSPLIGNYGINADDEESQGPKVAGFVVREASTIPSNYRSCEDLADYLLRHGVVGLEGVDTRELTIRLRDVGAMKCFMTTQPLTDAELLQKLAAIPELVGRDMVTSVTCSQSYEFGDHLIEEFAGHFEGHGEGKRRKVIAFDCGAKSTIFRSLAAVACDVHVVPANTTAADIMTMAPDGIFLSNGPGDPRPLANVTATVRELLGRVPIFGICLGHQILAQAIGAEVVKLKFGHHGSNHPVKDLRTGKIEITAQNHGFAVTPESLEKLGAKISHVNLNDGTVSGMELPDQRAFSVQYHPEASPGPHDSAYLFMRFRELMDASMDAGSV